MTLSSTPTSPRLIGLDLARTLALIGMAIYHLTWDLTFFGYVAWETLALPEWRIFARLVAGSFLFLAGVSLYLAHSRGVRRAAYLRRLGMIVLAALGITLVTFVAMRPSFIFFGILHSIAAASVIGLLFLRAPVAVTLLVAAIAFAAPMVARHAIFDAPWLLWVGLSQQVPPSNDYEPVLPWIAPFLIGMALCKVALSRGLIARWATWAPGRWAAILAVAGRHSLAIYLIHQPVLFALVWAMSQIAAPS